jgi:DnaJ like chaperone protein
MFYKILGAGIGFWLSKSLVGAGIGFGIGWMISSLTKKGTQQSSQGARNANNSQFRQSYQGGSSSPQRRMSQNLNQLSAAVMTADGKVLKSELNYVKSFFNQQFGPSLAQERIAELKHLLNQNINIQSVCWDLQSTLHPNSRSQVLHYLFGIAQADGHVSSEESNLLYRIAQGLGIGAGEFNSIKSMFVKNTTSSYKVLGIEKSATEQEIKKAYRKLAIKYHPDKVAQMGEEFQNNAKEKFQKIQDAYESIKKEKGFS